MKEPMTRIERYINRGELNDVKDEIESLIQDYGYSFEEASKIYELAQANLSLDAYIENGEALDDSLYEIGTAIENLSLAIQNLVTKIEDRCQINQQ